MFKDMFNTEQRLLRALYVFNALAVMIAIFGGLLLVSHHVFNTSGGGVTTLLGTTCLYIFFKLVEKQQ